MRVDEARALCAKLTGFLVSYEERKRGILESGCIPWPHYDGEPPFGSEAEAWSFARFFADNAPDRFVNIYVVTANFRPVPGYQDQKLRAYP